MTTVQELLTSLGPPPEEICIDWAWQLCDLTSSAGRARKSGGAIASRRAETKTLKLTPISACRQLTWEEVIVDSQGQLRIAPLSDNDPELTVANSPGSPDRWKAETLLTELLAWTDGEASQSDQFSQAALVAATKRVAKPADAGSESETGRKRSRSGGSTQRLESEGAETERNSSVCEGSAPMRLATASTESDATTAARRGFDASGDAAHARQPRKRETAVPQRLLRAITQSRGRFLVMIAVPVLLICGLGGLFQLGWLGSRSPADGDLDPAVGLAESLAESGTDALDDDPMASLGPMASQGGELLTATAEGSDEELLLLAESEVRERDQNGLTISESGSDRALDALTQLDQLTLSPLQLSPEEIIGAPAPQPIATDGAVADGNTQAADVALNAADGESSPMDVLDGVETIDVISELTAVTRTSEAAQTETSLEAQDTEALRDAQQAAFFIRTSPMVQVMRLPLASVPRTKQPAWKLKLAVSEGFSVEPSGPIEISESSVGSWIIVAERDEEPDNLTARPEGPESRIPVSRMVVQVQQIGKRGNSLRWRVAIVAEEMPQVTLPMGQQYLDALQANLAQVTTRLQSGIAQLRSLSATSGLPSRLRSQVYAQRRVFKSQLELVSRLRGITADANQMDGWLDGQIEVHAQFIDLASSDSTPLLQFGTF